MPKLVEIGFKNDFVNILRLTLDTLKDNKSPVPLALWLQISEKLSSCLPAFKVIYCLSKFQLVTININKSFIISIYFGRQQES